MEVAKTGQTEIYLESASNYQSQSDFTAIFTQEFNRFQKEKGISVHALQVELASCVYKKLDGDDKKTFDRKSVEKWLTGTIPDNIHQLVMIAHFFQKQKLEALDSEKDDYTNQIERLYLELNEKYLLSAKGRCLYIRKKRDLALYLAWRFDKFNDYCLILEDIKKCLSRQKCQNQSVSTEYEEGSLHACATYAQALQVIEHHRNFYEDVDSCIRKRLQEKLGLLDIVEKNSTLRGHLGELNRDFILEICAIREVSIEQVKDLLHLNHMQGLVKKPWGDLEYLALVDWQAAKKREIMAERMKLKDPNVELEVEDYMRYHKIWKKNVIGKLSFCLAIGEALMTLEQRGIYYNVYSVNYILDRLVSSVYRTSASKLSGEFLIQRLDKISEDVIKNTIDQELNSQIKRKREEEIRLSREFSQVAKNKRQDLQKEIKELEALSERACKGKFIDYYKGVYTTQRKNLLQLQNSKTPMYFSTVNPTQHLYVAIVYSVLTGHSFWGSTMNGYTTYLKDVKELTTTPQKKRAFMILLKIIRDILDEKEEKNIYSILKESIYTLMA